MSLTSIYLRNLSQIFLFYSEKSFLGKLHPLTKAVLMFAGIAIAFLCNKLVVLLLTLATFLSMALLSISVKRVVSLITSLMIFISPMILFSYIYSIFRSPSTTSLIGLSTSVATAIVRLLIMSLAFYIFFITTKPQSIARILNSIGIPYKYGYGFVIALRFLSVIASDLIEILHIQKTRGLFIRRNFLSRLRSSFAVFVPLIISALNRVDEVTIALEVKGFGLNSKRSYLYSEVFGFRDAIAVLLCLAGLAIAIRFCI